MIDSFKVVNDIQDRSFEDSNSTLIKRIHQLLASIGYKYYNIFLEKKN